MERRPVQVTVAGQHYRVVSSADEAELQRLAAEVEARIADVTPRGRPVVPQSLLLAALSLANELSEERAKRASLESKTRDVLRRALVRIDQVLENDDLG
jgi:cell division protein ZapA (FtsZ GTPase activity inhibitor)